MLALAPAANRSSGSARGHQSKAACTLLLLPGLAQLLPHFIKRPSGLAAGMMGDPDCVRTITKTISVLTATTSRPSAI
jgi:hypothetical protein